MQIAPFLPESISSSVCYKVLMDLSSRLKFDYDEDLAVRFINLMSYIDWTKQNLVEIEKHMFPMILEWTYTKELSERFWLCWLSGRYLQTLKDFLQYRSKQVCIGLPSKCYAFIRAVIGQYHFIDDIKYENGPVDAKHALFISNLANEIYSSDNVSTIKIDEQLNNLSTLENGFTKILSYELKRLYLMLSSITYFVPKFAICYNVIDALAIEFDFSQCNPERINAILLENGRNNQHIPLQMISTTERQSECELFDQFMVIRICLEIILNRKIDPAAAATKLKDIKMRLRNIISSTAYVEALEASFSLLFLRWEHVDHILDRTIESGSETSDNSNCTDKRRMHQQKTDKHGFVCAMDQVEEILKILKLSTNQKKHSNDMSESIGERFTRISDHINDAAWRLTLFRTELVNLKRIPIDTKQYLTMHNTPTEQKSSSDEVDSTEIKCEKKPTTRRRPRKRHVRKLDCGDRCMVDSIGSNQCSDRRCIVSKMLGTPQHLVTVCMNKGDTETSRQIIKVIVNLLIFFSVFQITDDMHIYHIRIFDENFRNSLHSFPDI